MLATYAAPFENNDNNNNNNLIQKKKEGLRNRTAKRREATKPPNPKIEAMMKKIHDDEEDDGLSDFNPIGNPESAGVERMDNVNILSQSDMEQPTNITEQFTQLPSEYAKQYYQQYVPYYNQSSDNITHNGIGKDELLTKLNHVIYLLEEQQDQNTGHVTEELVLYSFLGIFIIFIVDSFARVGKYVR